MAKLDFLEAGDASCMLGSTFMDHYGGENKKKLER